MSYSSDGIISAPVSIRDVLKVLKESSSDLGTLCTSNKINKWAKFKPFKYDSISIIPTLDSNGYPQVNENIGSHYKCLKSKNCGLKLSEQNQSLSIGACLILANTILTLGNDDDVWLYIKPTGGSLSPYRLVDFCGYNHNALPFIWLYNPQTRIYLYKSDDSYHRQYFYIEVYDSNNETVVGMIEPSDLGDYGSLYYCCVLCNSSIENATTVSEASNLVIAYSISSNNISDIDGRSAMFTINSNNGTYSIQGQNGSSGTVSSSITLKVYHLLAKQVNNNYNFIPMPYSNNLNATSIITNFKIEEGNPSIEISDIYINDRAFNVSDIARLDNTFLNLEDTSSIISINGWFGATFKFNFTNTSSTSKTLNLGEFYCRTNCHNGYVYLSGIFIKENGTYSSVSPSLNVIIDGNSTKTFYITFSNIFDFDGGTPPNSEDVEIEFSSTGGEVVQYNGGGDGTIMYYNS